MDDEEAAIRALIDSEAVAWNHGDAKGYAAHFRHDGTFTNVLGITYFGKDAFETRHAEIFAGIYKGSFVKMMVKRIHFVRPDVAIVDIAAELSGFKTLSPTIHAPDGIVRGSLLQVFVKEKQEWTIAAYHNIDVKPLPPPKVDHSA